MYSGVAGVTLFQLRIFFAALAAPQRSAPRKTHRERTAHRPIRPFVGL
jgi:hypothetical protein